ncbi:MAG: beta-galactosidase [Armatimonadetes bacterium]|nr:beta-galactosidase [Armatimonadota bacterium]
MFLALLAISPCFTQVPSYIVNGRFDGTRGWIMPMASSIVVDRPGNRCVLIEEGMATQSVFRRPSWQRMTVACDIRVEEVRVTAEGGFAYAAIYQYSEDGALVAFRDFVQLREPAEWKRYTYTFDLTPDTATINVHFGFYRAVGRAYFDDFTLVEGDQPRGIDEVTEWMPAGIASERVVVWSEADLPVPPGGVDPSWAVNVLRSAGLDAQAATTEQMAELLRPGANGLLVLGYGPAYPMALRSQIVDFCRAGGKLVVVGGYPLNDPMVRENGRWVNWAQRWRAVREEKMRWPNNLLPDGGFEKADNAPVGGVALDGQWHREDASRCFIETSAEVEGTRVATVKLDPQAPGPGEPVWYAWMPVKPGHEYAFRAWIKTRDVKGRHFAFVALYQYSGDRLVKPYDLVQLTGDNDWREVSYTFQPAYEVDRVFIKFGLYGATGQVWLDKAQLIDVTGLRYRPLNTSSGKPGDGLELMPYQMGMCDAHYRLRRAVSVEPAPGQTIMGGGKIPGTVEGWVAAGVTGWDNARWVPLLVSKDRYGRPRGAAAALLLNYSGFYARSLSAYFGVENKPLFGPAVPGSAQRLAVLTKWLLRGCFLHNLRGEKDLYKRGEPVTIRARVSNYGAQPLVGTVEMTAYCKGKLVASGRAPVNVSAGDTGEFAVTIKPSAAARGLLEIDARLATDNQVIDQAKTGVVLRDEAEVRAGPRLEFRDNYFRLNDRPVFLFGSDNYSNDYQAGGINPYRWDQIQRIARDCGLQVYEILQYTKPGHVFEEEDWRSFEAMAQMLMKRGLVFMCGILIGHNVAVNDDELAAQGRMCSEYARRLGKTPGLLWYINGDFQLRYEDLPWLKKAWNEYLTGKYGSDQALARAWRTEQLPAPLGQLDFPPPNSGAWDDPVEVERQNFNVWLMRRWIERHVQEIRAGDPSHPITSEYYQDSWHGLDLRLTLNGHDVSNFGFFSTPRDDLIILPERIAFNDMRYAGKSVNLGEYGVKTHPAWSIENGAAGYHIVRTEQQQKQLFLTVAAYALGMGVSKIQNWCLRDADEWVFPWGILYPNDFVPKDVAYAHRNLSLMWRLLAPKYEAPQVTVLAPTPLRLGNSDVHGRQAIFMAAQALLRLHIPFNVADDFAAASLPTATKTLIWPAALAAREEDFQAVLEWVRRGGQLLVSGYPGWDEMRQQLGPQRLAALTGCTAAELLFAGPERYRGPELLVGNETDTLLLRPQVRIKPGPNTEVLLAADGHPVLTRRKVENGVVIWLADPLEFAGREEIEALCRVYARAFAALQQSPVAIKVSPNDHRLHVMRQKTATADAYVVYGTADDAPNKVTIETTAGPVELTARPWWPAVAVVSNDGKVLLALAAGGITINGEQIVAGGPMVGVASLDGQDLRRSQAVVVCPFEAGELKLPALPAKGEWGEWRDGVWTRLEDANIRTASLRVDADQATCVALLCKGAVAPSRNRCTQLWTKPWEVPGY